MRLNNIYNKTSKLYKRHSVKESQYKNIINNINPLLEFKGGDRYKYISFPKNTVFMDDSANEMYKIYYVDESENDVNNTYYTLYNVADEEDTSTISHKDLYNNLLKGIYYIIKYPADHRIFTPNEPENDGSEFDESYKSKNKRLDESFLKLAFQSDECLPNTNFPKSWMTDTPSNHDQLYGFYDNDGWIVSKFNPLTDLTIFEPKNNFVFNIDNNALKEGMLFILSIDEIKLLEIVKINIRTVNVRERKTDSIYPLDKKDVFSFLLNNKICVMDENIEEPENDGSEWDE